MNDNSPEHTSPNLGKGRVAVLLYGLLREYRLTAPAFLRHVANPNDADIFYFGPEQTDTPDHSHFGKLDAFGAFIDNPKGRVHALVDADVEGLQDAYGERLLRSQIHHVAQERFIDEAREVVNPEDWYYKLDPYRLFSMFYNLQGAAKLLSDVETESGVIYDTVIITRPDLAFFAPLETGSIKPGEIHIASGEGFDGWGAKRNGNSSALYFRDALNGDYVPGGATAWFNDQVFAVKRDAARLFEDVYDKLPRYLERKVPITPETILYLHLVVRGGLKPVERQDWIHQIYRKGDPIVQSVADTGQIMFIDRNHRAAKQMRRARPIAALFRDGKYLWRRGARWFSRL